MAARRTRAFPPSVIRTLDPDAPFRLAFGSCRRSEPFDEEHFDALGADALVALADADGRDARTTTWPDILLLLGDQVYADDPSDAISERLRDAHDDRHDSEVADEIQNYEEYTWLYHEAWMPPAVRWLLSTVPPGCCSTTTTCATTGTPRCRGVAGSPRSRGGMTASSAPTPRTGCTSTSAT